MPEIEFSTSFKKMSADIYTPIGIYLRLRDKYRDTILLESTDFHAGENSRSIIAINAIAGIEITNLNHIEFKLPGQVVQHKDINEKIDLPELLWNYMKKFKPGDADQALKVAQAMFGYSSYEAVQYFEKISFSAKTPEANAIPLMRYRLYQYVIIIDHFKDIMYLCENHFPGMPGNMADLESAIKSKDVPVFPFNITEPEEAHITDQRYIAMVKNGISACFSGDVFQVVLSRRFYQKFKGDDFNVYRALRNINPSPYLFYFDYGDYKLMGSSPESQVIIENKRAVVHPIAGTFRRSGDDDTDKELAIKLENDPKENAEHVMLVDLARNDLSRVCSDVSVTEFKKVKFYSHVIHLVSEVQGKTATGQNPFQVFGSTFPAGTLSGAPKYKAMQIIDENENSERGFYGGAIGFVGFDGSFNHAIIIRSFLSKNNTLISQAGAGIVAASIPESELLEVKNKLSALKSAILFATTITQ